MMLPAAVQVVREVAYLKAIRCGSVTGEQVCAAMGYAQITRLTDSRVEPNCCHREKSQFACFE